ncbi:hypothetical protein CMV_006537 [Castanea mollissima]|uniref:Calcium-transporting ATPase n=1 Tax=Castanea mollissima TaxID=60419 RepID=A0A8J4VTC2_9ROSI|nr:hypothetical protein CMV_006537 [Castanea mollissima]
MFESNSNQACDTEAQTLGAGLLITTTTTTTSPKYGRFWRKSLYVGIFITLKKTPDEQESPLSSPSYVALPEEPPAASEILIDVYSDNGRDIDHVDDEQPFQETVAEIVKIVKQKDLNRLRRLGGDDWDHWVLARLRSNSEDGIEGGQDQAWNSVKEKGFFYFFSKACGSYTNVLLLVSTVLSFVTGIIEKGRKDGWHDGVAILVALVLLVAFPSVGNYLHERKMAKKKLKNMEKLEVLVERGENSQWISISKVVVGNIVLLEEGDRVPADGLLVSREDLMVDEVLKSKINHERNPFLFSGSKVIKGKGRMLVTSVGDNTAMGKPLSLVTDQPNEKTVFQGRIEKPSIYMDMIALCVTVLISLVVLIRLLQGNHSNSNGLPELKGNVSVDTMTKIFEKIALKSKGKIWILTSALTAVVIGIQHGMPFVITVSLYCWKEKVQLSGAHPQNLLACGTMGLVTVIYIDATGGLMCEPVEVSEVFVGEKDIKINGDQYDPPEALKQGIDVSLRVSEISVSPTNALLISWAKKRCSSDVHLPSKFEILDHKSCIKKGSGALMRKKCDDEKIMHLHWDGAASAILEMCSHYYDINGESHAIEGQKKEFKKRIKVMEDKGLIPIAFAYRKIEVQELKEDGLSLLAIVGLKYPCQKEFKSAVQALGKAGVRVKLVSGDHPSVVRAMAFELGIIGPRSTDVALKGEDIQKLKTREEMEKLDRATVVGSCLPEHKVCMIQCSKRKGHIVAFVGGSTTIDILALKEADVGIIELTQSTKLVEEFSDITLKGYRSLVPVLKFGRCCYHNIQKFIQLQFTACLSGLLISLVMTMVRGESPITGFELMWLNLVLCLLGGVVMKMELKSEELLTNQLAKGTQSLLTKAVWVNIAMQASYQASILLLFQLKGQAITDMNDAVRKTMVFNTFILCQIFNQFNAMDLVKWEVFWDFLQNYSLLLTLTDVIVVQAVLIHYLGSITQFERLNAVQWTCCLLVAALPLALRWLAAGIRSLLLSSLAMPLPNGMPSPYVSYLGVPFFTILLLALPALFTTIINYDENVPSGCK